ncbi:MAG: endonuclease [Cryobacterium sp.]|nr:endonuclease [Oligoflexia bacterium]
MKTLVPFTVVALAFGILTSCRSAPSVSPPTEAHEGSTPLAKITSEAPNIGNHSIRNFRDAKKIAAKLHSERGLTLYCRCRYAGKKIDGPSCGYEVDRSEKRASVLEWEHVVPAEAFGQSFSDWREGSDACVSRKGKRYRGRKCAEKNPEFARMEADLYNLFPEVGEVNGLRSNYSMAEVGALGKFAGITFGGCEAKVFKSKFEPMDFAKGTVARAYFYMEDAYPGRGIVSEKNRKLFEAWDKMHPVEPWECDLYRRIRKVQTNPNPVLESRCGAASE